MRVLPFLLLPWLAACAGSAAHSAWGSGAPEFRDFLAADRDNSGKLSPQEAQAFPVVAQRFQRYDADGDGLIAWNELLRVGGVEEDRRRNYVVPSGP